MKFEISSEYKPTGDQPQAIRSLVDGINKDVPFQTLLGVTGSGKTFTMANVIQEVQRPTLILSHNKTLAAQLYSEMKQFFPNNKVEYFVSYYDYYQPEAYLPTTGTYIEKDLSINEEIEKLRLAATSSLLSGRRDVIVVSSVSCMYGIGNPEDFNSNIIELSVGMDIGRNQFLRQLVDSLYSRNDVGFEHGNFRVKGDTVDVFPGYADFAFRFIFWGDEIEEISMFDPISGQRIENVETATLYPASIFVTSKDTMHKAIRNIQDDLVEHIQFFKDSGKAVEAQRIEERVEYDMEMMRELGYCPGVENYSRYFDGRDPGTRPFCLIDYFPEDYLTVVDESHVTLPQVRAMYGGDRARKTNLVEYGFRLPAAMDNRPLKFEEWESMINQIVYVSATPADYELERSEGVIVEQIIRPTGLLDPLIDIRPSENQIDDLLHEVNLRIEKDERILVTTLTKRMAEELSKYFQKMGVRTSYIHSDVDTLDRIKILEGLRKGETDVLVGINLLREGLDLPEVSLVAILDADKEGFLRSERSLVQTAGRAARNINGLVIMYADKVTASMQKTIDATNYRREKQIKYNTEHGLTPQPIIKASREIVGMSSKLSSSDTSEAKVYAGVEGGGDIAADPVVQYMGKAALEKAIVKAKSDMESAAKELDFMLAAQHRDEMFRLQQLLKRDSS